MLDLMAKNRRFFIVGHILLDVGLLGYISSNAYLTYTGLIGSLICFSWAFVAEEHIAKEIKTEGSINN